MIKLTHNLKVSKKEAYEIVLNYKKSCELSESDIDKLINYFAPPIPKKSKTVEQWVALAAGTKNEPRTNLRYLHVLDGFVYATDGDRLHWGKTDLQNGWYNPKTLLPVTYDKQPVNYMKIINQTTTCEACTVVVDNLVKVVVSMKINAFCLPGDVFINEKYFNEAVQGRESIVVKTSNQLIHSSNEFGEFIILGVRV